MFGLKQIFTWWHNQTVGTFLKTFFFGKFVGKDKYGNKYYTDSKKIKRWVIYQKNIESTTIPSDWFLWIHHTIDQSPNINDSKKKHFSWEKEHLENKTGSPQARRSKLKREINKKYETWK